MCQLESASLLNASARCKSACCHIILPLGVLDGWFMALKRQPVAIALHCPMRLSHKIVLAVTPCCRSAELTLLRSAGSSEEASQVLGTGSPISWQHLCAHQEHVLSLLVLL